MGALLFCAIIYGPLIALAILGASVDWLCEHLHRRWHERKLPRAKVVRR